MRHATLTRCLALISLTLAWPAAAQTPPGSAGTVTLPLSEYDRLIDRAGRPPAVPELPPVAAVVASADLQLRVSGSRLRGVLTFQGEVLRQGRVKVPLVSGGTLVEVQQSGSAVAVVYESGTTSALLSGPGLFTLTAVIAADTVIEPGRASAVLPAVRAGTVHASLETPGDSVDVRVDRGLVGARSSSGGRTVVDIALDPGVPARVSWSSREQAVRAPRELRFVTDAKTLVTIGENDLRVATLVDVNVLQGRAEQLEMLVPQGFEVVNVSGSSVDIGGRQPGRLRLDVKEPDRRRCQFLVTLEKTAATAETSDTPTHTEIALPVVTGTQRETAEVAWESAGTVDLKAAEAGPLRRLDVSEVHASLAALARTPLLAAFRYQRRGNDPVQVGFDVRRFPDAAVLGAAVQSATITTLVTSEGRALTEYVMTVSNRGQMFLKVAVPKGATLLSATVGGAAVKPVEAPDGARVPLVRPGFRPTGAYQASFVYLESGTAMGRKGDGEMRLPRLDIPIGLLEWEVFLPDRYKVKRFEGDVMPAQFMPSYTAAARAEPDVPPPGAAWQRLSKLGPDDIGGIVVDATGAVLPGVTVRVRAGSTLREAITDAWGVFVASSVPAGVVTIDAKLEGFKSVTSSLRAGERRPVRLVMQVGALAETVQVTGETPVIQPPGTSTWQQPTRDAAQAPSPRSELLGQAASQNVLNLQQRVSGVLPVRIDVPRSGKSYLFVRPLVIEEETVLRFQYKQ